MKKYRREVKKKNMYKATLLKFRNAALGIATLVSVFAFASAPVAFAAPTEDELRADYGFDDLTDLNVSQSEESAQTIIVRLINFALTFLGLIAVILILWGGFKWMTAGGNDEQVGEAKKIIIAAVIGLAIIISAYAITNFFTTAIFNAVETGDSNS